MRLKKHYVPTMKDPTKNGKPYCNQKVGDLWFGRKYLHESDCKKCQNRALATSCKDTIFRSPMYYYRSKY